MKKVKTLDDLIKHAIFSEPLGTTFEDVVRKITEETVKVIVPEKLLDRDDYDLGYNNAIKLMINNAKKWMG